MNLEEFLTDFAYSAPYAVGPVAQVYYEGEWNISPAGMFAWGVIGYGLEKAILGQTTLRVYGGVALESLFGELGLFRVLGVTRALSVITPVGFAVALGVAAGQPHPPEFNLHRYRSR